MSASSFVPSQASRHFFTKAAYGGLRPTDVLAMSDDAAELMLAQARWGGDGSKQACPVCGLIDSHYRIRTRRQYTCRGCKHRFSVTSKTPLAWHKLSLQEVIYYIVQQAAAAKGKSSLEMARGMAACVSTTYVLGMKLRQAIHAYQSALTLEGEVEMDGAYINTYVRPHRVKAERKDGRKKEHTNPDKRCVFVMRQRSGEPGKGALKTVAAIILSENEADIRKLVGKHVRPGSTIYTDQNAAYNALHGYYDVKSVNHDEEFSTANEGGINQNQAESFHLRVRRMVMGQTHKAGPHFEMYASEMAFREDTRRMSKAEIVGLMLKCLLTAPLSQGFTKYGRVPSNEEGTLVKSSNDAGTGNVIPMPKAA